MHTIFLHDKINLFQFGQTPLGEEQEHIKGGQSCRTRLSDELLHRTGNSQRKSCMNYRQRLIRVLLVRSLRNSLSPIVFNVVFSLPQGAARWVLCEISSLSMPLPPQPSFLAVHFEMIILLASGMGCNYTYIDQVAGV